jgi:hypothetical protein
VIACIVGGGPSLADTLPTLREMQASGAQVWACNGAYPYLVKQEIHPQAFVLVDRRKENAAFVARPVTGCIHYLDERCHPDVVAKLSGYAVKRYDQYKLRAGGTVTSHAMLLARQAGATDQHFFGIDCCYLDDMGHAYSQPWNEGEDTQTVTMYGRQWRVAPWMLAQAADFLTLERKFKDLRFTVHGNGLWARSREKA